MMGAFDTHPLLVLAMGLAGLPLLAGGPRFLHLRRRGWLLPFCGALSAAVALALRQMPDMAVPMPEGLMAWPWLSAWLLMQLLPLALLLRIAPLSGPGPGFWLAAAPVPVFWALMDPFAGRVPLPWLPLATGTTVFILLALLTGAEEKYRQNRPPGGMSGLPFRLLVLACILLLMAGLESLLAGRLP